MNFSAGSDRSVFFMVMKRDTKDDTADVRILNDNLVKGAYNIMDRWHIRGDVINSGNTKKSIYVKGILCDNKNNALDYQYELKKLEPGEKSSFEIGFYQPPENYDHYKLDVVDCVSCNQ